MLNSDEIQLYDRQIRVKDFGIAGQEKLKGAHVLVIGAGGLACPLLQYLCAAGVGNISVCDGDRISISNLQRQILYTANDVGKPKVQVAIEKLKSINPNINLFPLQFYLDANSALACFPGKDLIIDCSDNFGTRYLVNDVCYLLGIPFVSAALFQKEAQLGIFNVPDKNGNCSASYRDTFPENEKNTLALDCNTAGVIATLPGIMGLYQANECIKYLTHPELSPINKVLFIDCWNLQHTTFNVIPSTDKKLNEEEIRSHQYAIPCVSNHPSILNDDQLNQLINRNNNVLFIDVREKDEEPIVENGSVFQIPLSDFQDNIHSIPSDLTLVFVCKAGSRSRKAMEIFKKLRPVQECWSYAKGMHDLIQNNFFQKLHV